MSKFAEIPRFLLEDFFDSMIASSSESPFVDGITAPICSFFYLMVEKQYDNYSQLYQIPFEPYTPYYSGNFFYARRMTTMETSATSAIEIDADSLTYLKKSSSSTIETITMGDSVYYAGAMNDYVRAKYSDDTTILDFISVNKPFLYFGKIYPETGDVYRIEYWGMDRYAVSCLPDHMQTTNIGEIFKVFFDQVYNRIYNKARTISTLIDPLEIDLDYITYLASFFGIEIDKTYLDSLYYDRDSLETRIRERRLREYVRELPNSLKRKGTYTSLYIIFKNLFWNTTDKINIYERWHSPTICNGWPTNPNAIPETPLEHFVDINYLNYYNQMPTTCVSAGYVDLINAGGYPVPLTNCYIHEQKISTTSWIIVHNLNTQTPLVQCYDQDMNLIVPQSIEGISSYLTVVTFNTNKSGYAFILLPNSTFTFTDTTSGNFQHDLNYLVPIVHGYESNFTECDLYSVSPSGSNIVIISSLSSLNGTITCATSGNYVHEQLNKNTIWNIEHDLDSRAVVADFYTTTASEHWTLSHVLNTENILVQLFDTNNVQLDYENINIVNDEIVKVTFSEPVSGYAVLVEAEEISTTPISSGWVLTTPTSGYYATQYTDNDGDVLSIDWELPFLNATLHVHESPAVSATFMVKTPDYMEMFLYKSATWDIVHNLDQQQVLAQFYTTYKSTTWEFSNFYGNNVIIRCYDTDRNEIRPDSIAYYDDRYYLNFNEPVGGFITISIADASIQDTLYFGYGGWFAGTGWFLSPGWFLPAGFTGVPLWAPSSSYWPGDLFIIDPDIDTRVNLITQYQSNITKALIMPVDVQLTLDGLIYTTFSAESSGAYAHVIKGNYVHEQVTPASKWWITHYLDTYKIISATYSWFTDGGVWMYMGQDKNTIVQTYDNNNLCIDGFSTIHYEDESIYIMNNEPIIGFGCMIVGNNIPASGATWNINHNLNNELVLCQCYIDDLLVVCPDVQLNGDNDLIVNFTSPVSGSCVYALPDYTWTQTTPSASWIISHNLNQIGAIIQIYDGNLRSIATSAANIELTDRNTCTITFSVPTSGYIAIKGTHPPIFEHLPKCRLYDENWLELDFEGNWPGYTIIKVADDCIITPLNKVTPETLTLSSSANCTASWGASGTIGYALICKADATAKPLKQKKPTDYQIIDENNCRATFSDREDGLAILKEVGTLTYNDGLIMSPHYKVEIDVNCEPLSQTNIIESTTLNQVIASWETVRPACKFPHYGIFIAPKVDFTTNKKDLYDERFDDVKVYSYATVSTSGALVDSYLFSQYYSDTEWNITHNLGTYELLIQCYDYNRNLIYPEDIILNSTDTLTVSFYNQQNGFVLIMKAKENFINTADASASWYIEHHQPNEDVLTDYYFYSDHSQILPSNVEMQIATKEFEVVWYVPTLGYCRIRDYEYLHVQSETSYTWNIEHNLKHDGVFVQCFDLEHQMILPDNIQLDKYNKQVIISFIDNPVSGYAIITAVGSTFCKTSLIESMSAGGYIKIGAAENTDLWDATSNNDIKDSNYLQTQTSLKVTEDAQHYYVLGEIKNQFVPMSITEMGLFTQEDELIFYTYVKQNCQLAKIAETDFAVLYRIEK